MIYAELIRNYKNLRIKSLRDNNNPMVGGLDYIRGYQSSNTETHNTLVSPEHIGAIPDDSTGAIRVIQYFTLDAFSGVNGSIYHSSTYAQLTDAQFAENRKEVIEAFNKLAAEQFIFLY